MSFLYNIVGLESQICITKTCPCNVYPLEPHFYIEKLGFVGVYLFFLFLLQNIDCGYSLEPPRRGGSNVYPQSMFWSKNKKNIQKFLLKLFIFYNLKNLCILHGHVFVMFCPLILTSGSREDDIRECHPNAMVVL